MKRILNFTGRALPFLLAAFFGSAGCTLKSQDPPPLTGPSEFGTSIVITVSPDVLALDGASQSLVTITARDAAGNGVRNLSMRAEISVGGVRTDFGSISARNLVTDSNGRATLVYTAPAAPSGPAVDPDMTVQILVTPIGTDAANAVTRLANIRLIAPGVVIPPDGLHPAFTFAPSSPSDHQNVLFDASTSTAPPNNPIASYSWNFGDGSTGSGRTASHSFNTAGTYIVTLTIGDAFNRTASTTQTLDVSGGNTPTANFTTSPASPRVGENVNFNGSGSTPATGRTIRSYAWDFGDGQHQTTTGATTTHSYQSAGTFTVTLVVTDDAGRTGFTTGTVGIGSDTPTADFTFSPASPTVGAQVSFTSTSTAAVPGRTITSSVWSWGDGTPAGSGPTVNHSFSTAGSYSVTLTITDSAGKTASATKTVQVQ
jgi:PKD repeat protein